MEQLKNQLAPFFCAWLGVLKKKEQARGGSMVKKEQVGGGFGQKGASKRVNFGEKGASWYVSEGEKRSKQKVDLCIKKEQAGT